MMYRLSIFTNATRALYLSADTYIFSTVGYFKSVKANKNILCEYVIDNRSSL